MICDIARDVNLLPNNTVALCCLFKICHCFDYVCTVRSADKSAVSLLLSDPAAEVFPRLALRTTDNCTVQLLVKRQITRSRDPEGKGSVNRRQVSKRSRSFQSATLLTPYFEALERFLAALAGTLDPKT